MGRMADTVLKKSNAAEKEAERRAIQYAIDLDNKKAKEEKDRIEAARKRDQDIKMTLDQQMKEQKARKELEM